MYTSSPLRFIASLTVLLGTKTKQRPLLPHPFDKDE